jgi:hypothetical protein
MYYIFVYVLCFLCVFGLKARAVKNTVDCKLPNHIFSKVEGNIWKQKVNKMIFFLRYQ